MTDVEDIIKQAFAENDVNDGGSLSIMAKQIMAHV